MKYKTIREATESWVHGMEFIHLGLIKDAVRGREEAWHELTPLTIGESVYCSNAINLKGEICDGYGEIVKISKENVVVRMADTDEDALADKNYVYDEEREEFPMWYIMFQPRESIDEEWISQNLQAVADCGFRIYEHDDYGIYLGIDGCGYDFYSEHWIPLYKARGLQWHDEEDSYKNDSEEGAKDVRQE